MRIYERLPGRIHAARAEARLAGAMATEYLDRLSVNAGRTPQQGAGLSPPATSHGSESSSREH